MRRLGRVLAIALLVLLASGGSVLLLTAGRSRRGQVATASAHADRADRAQADPASVADLPPPASGFAIPRPRRLRKHAEVTRWAPVVTATMARERPSSHSPAVVAVERRTPEGTTNLVVADGEAVRGGVTWVHVRLAVLPDSRTGWIPRDTLGGWSFVSTHLVIDRARETLTLYRADRVIFRARVGVGKPATPTPAGQFYIRDRLTRYASPEYGPLAFGTSARSPFETDWPAGGFIGIHGTDEPDLIPGRISHGCIRLRNATILALGRLLPIGTPVTIT
jgi:lipoprotein-anchoring transpeptidase ErfK/SrfK